MWGVLTPAIELWKFKSPKGLPSPHFGSVSLILTLSQNRVVTNDSSFSMPLPPPFYGNHFVGFSNMNEIWTFKDVMSGYNIRYYEDQNGLQNPF
jgi:hypothetical protein